MLIEIKDRLFPFGRGLVHDNMAPNIWSIYMFIDFMVTKTGKLFFNLNI